MAETKNVLLIPSTAIAASGNSEGAVPGGLAPDGNPYSQGCATGSLDKILVAVTVASINAGTITFTIESLGLDGVWYNVTPTALGASLVFTAAGAGTITLAGNNSAASEFGSTIRLRWVLSGGANAVTFSASIIGKG